MYFDRLDICEAYYMFLSHYHEGQASEKYARLCRMSRYFTPSPFLSLERLSENAKHFYGRLVQKEKQKNLNTRNRNAMRRLPNNNS